ncbi:MAG TPA: M48 family metallopeptidase [Allosphingosinicella sp.]|nr:M48 family metallopeptidase [Allosphingosinicella sp.]
MEGGWLYDGTTAVRHEIEVGAGGDALLIRYADGGTSRVPREKLFHVDTRGAWEVYGHCDVDGWRLGVPGAAAATLGPLLPPRRRYGRWIDRIGLVRAVLAAVAVSALIVFLATLFPSWVAPYVPRAWEEAVGGPIVASLDGHYCHGPGGDEALRKLASAIAPDAQDLDIRVVNVDIVNAAALPGGHILIFAPLLTQADGPDEVAGVLAHEIAHVERRHVTAAMIRQLSFGLFVTLVGGGTGANLETFLSARYSRSAEAEADADAIAALQRARVSPGGAAGFFDRVARQQNRLGAIGAGLSYISTHPEPELRARRFRASAEGGSGWKPPLSAAEWRALVDICRNDPAQNRG